MKQFLIAVALLINPSVNLQAQNILVTTDTTAIITSNTELTAACQKGQAIAKVDVSFTSGFYYMQFRINDTGHGTNRRVGVGVGLNGMNFNGQLDGQTIVYGFDYCPECPKGTHLKVNSGAYNTSLFDTTIDARDTLGKIAPGDTVGMYVDLINRFIYIDIDGKMLNNGDPSSGSVGKGALWGFPPSTAYYFLCMSNCAATQPWKACASSDISLISPAVGGGYGYTNL